MDLCVRLFEQQNPYFVLDTLAEQWLALRVAGEQVVNSDCLPFAVFTYFYTVNPQFVYLPCDEQTFYQSWTFGEHCQCREEPFVT